MLLNISYSDYPNFNVYNIKYEVRLVLNIAEDLRSTFHKITSMRQSRFNNILVGKFIRQLFLLFKLNAS